MEIGDHIFAHVSLAREAEVSHLALHNNLLILFAVDDFRVYTLQNFNCAGDACLELFECLLVVFECRNVLGAETGGEEFGCVGAGLDLVGESNEC